MTIFKVNVFFGFTISPTADTYILQSRDIAENSRVIPSRLLWLVRILHCIILWTLLLYYTIIYEYNTIISSVDTCGNII